MQPALSGLSKRRSSRSQRQHPCFAAPSPAVDRARQNVACSGRMCVCAPRPQHIAALREEFRTANVVRGRSFEPASYLRANDRQLLAIQSLFCFIASRLHQHRLARGRLLAIQSVRARKYFNDTSQSSSHAACHMRREHASANVPSTFVCADRSALYDISAHYVVAQQLARTSIAKQSNVAFCVVGA